MCKRAVSQPDPNASAAETDPASAVSAAPSQTLPPTLKQLEGQEEESWSFHGSGEDPGRARRDVASPPGQREREQDEDEHQGVLWPPPAKATASSGFQPMKAAANALHRAT
jgi:hypothetical protein